MAFTEKLEALLLNKSWKPVHLAAELTSVGHSVSPYTVERWLAGKNMPRVEHVAAMADIFGITTDAVLGRETAASVVE